MVNKSLTDDIEGIVEETDDIVELGKTVIEDMAKVNKSLTDDIGGLTGKLSDLAEAVGRNTQKGSVFFTATATRSRNLDNEILTYDALTTQSDQSMDITT